MWRVLLAGLLASATWAHLAPWTSTQSLWQHVAEQAPTKPMAFIQLAGVKMDRHDYPHAEPLLFHALDVSARRPDKERLSALDLILANLAIMRFNQGRWLEARNLLKERPAVSARADLCRRFHQLMAIVCDA